MLEPCNDDAYEAASKVKCKCIGPIDMENRMSKEFFQRDFEQCCLWCSICNKKHVKIVSFDYLPFTALPTTLMRTNNFFHVMSCIMRSNWQELPPMGNRAREWSNFFDTSAIYELPQICPNAKCESAFWAFLEHFCVAGLINGWIEESWIFFILLYLLFTTTSNWTKTHNEGKKLSSTLFVIMSFNLVCRKEPYLIYSNLTFKK